MREVAARCDAEQLQQRLRVATEKEAPLEAQLGESRAVAAAVLDRVEAAAEHAAALQRLGEGLKMAQQLAAAEAERHRRWQASFDTKSILAVRGRRVQAARYARFVLCACHERGLAFLCQGACVDLA